MSLRYPGRAQHPVEGARYFRASTGAAVGITDQRIWERSLMRGMGTGQAPEGQFPTGQVVDGTPEYIGEMVRRGWVERVHPLDDPGRTPIGIAQAVIRGDALSHPVDNAAAQSVQGFGVNPEEGVDPYAVVMTQDPDANEVPEPVAGPLGSQTDDWGIEDLDADPRLLVGPANPAGAQAGDEGQGQGDEVPAGVPSEVTSGGAPDDEASAGEVESGSMEAVPEEERVAGPAGADDDDGGGETLEDLRAEARSRGIAVSGSKAELRERLGR